MLRTRRKPAQPAEVIDLRDHAETRIACPGCGANNWQERLGAFHCVDCGLRIGEPELPPLTP